MLVHSKLAVDSEVAESKEEEDKEDCSSSCSKKRKFVSAGRGSSKYLQMTKPDPEPLEFLCSEPYAIL